MYAIAISDVHLGYDAKCAISDFKAFIQYLKGEEVEHLILMGDILDLWRRDNKNVLEAHKDLLDEINGLPSVTNKHWVWGNHDYEPCLTPLISSVFGNFELTDVLRLHPKNGEKYVFIHGHQVEFGKWAYELAGSILCHAGDGVGAGLTHAWDSVQGLIEGKNRLEKWILKNYFEFIQRESQNREKGLVIGTIQRWFWKQFTGYQPMLKLKEKKVRDIAAKRVGLKHNERLIFGHTHEYWDGQTLANTGCWYKNTEHKYYAIDNNGVGQLKTWP